MSRPVIGVTVDAEKPGGYSKFPWYALRQNYLDAIDAAGGLPVALPHEPDRVGDYLERLCLAYSPARARIRLAPGLLAPLPVERRTDPNVCVVLLSGGKDSIAAGILAMRRGYRVHAVSDGGGHHL